MSEQSDTAGLQAWADRVAETVGILEHVQQHLTDLAQVPAGGSPGERLAVLNAAWRQLGLTAPGLAALEERARALAVRMVNGAESGRFTFLALLRTLEAAQVQALDGGGHDEAFPVLRAADFGGEGGTRLLRGDIGGALLCGLIASLPEGHWGRTLLSPLDLHTIDGRDVLVLGPERQPWYPAADVRRRTLSFSAARRRQIDEVERRLRSERLQAEERVPQADRLAERIAALEEKLAAAQAVPAEETPR